MAEAWRYECFGGTAVEVCVAWWHCFVDAHTMAARIKLNTYEFLLFIHQAMMNLLKVTHWAGELTKTEFHLWQAASRWSSKGSCVPFCQWLYLRNLNKRSAFSRGWCHPLNIVLMLPMISTGSCVVWEIIENNLWLRSDAELWGAITLSEGRWIFEWPKDSKLVTILDQKGANYLEWVSHACVQRNMQCNFGWPAFEEDTFTLRRTLSHSETSVLPLIILLIWMISCS